MKTILLLLVWVAIVASFAGYRYWRPLTDAELSETPITERQPGFQAEGNAALGAAFATSLVFGAYLAQGVRGGTLKKSWALLGLPAVSAVVVALPFPFPLANNLGVVLFFLVKALYAVPGVLIWGVWILCISPAPKTTSCSVLHPNQTLD